MRVARWHGSAMSRVTRWGEGLGRGEVRGAPDGERSPGCADDTDDKG